jgi:Fanconi anemia group J protein
MASASTYLQEKVGKNMADLLPNPDANKEKSLSPKDQIKGHPRNKSPKLRKFDQYGEKTVSLTKCEAAATKLKSQDQVEVQASMVSC